MQSDGGAVLVLVRKAGVVTCLNRKVSEVHGGIRSRLGRRVRPAVDGSGVLYIPAVLKLALIHFSQPLGRADGVEELTCHELEGLGDLRLIGIGFRNSTHFDERVLKELKKSV